MGQRRDRLVRFAEIMDIASQKGDEGVHVNLLVKLRICKSAHTAYNALAKLGDLGIMEPRREMKTEGRWDKHSYVLTPYGRGHAARIRVVRSKGVSLTQEGLSTATIKSFDNIPFDIEVRSGSKLWASAQEKTVLYLGNHPGSLDPKYWSYKRGAGDSFNQGLRVYDI